MNENYTQAKKMLKLHSLNSNNLNNQNPTKKN